MRDIQLSALSDLMCHLLGAICQTHVSPQAATLAGTRLEPKMFVNMFSI